MFYAFIYLYYISDITSDIIVQTCHQIHTLRDLGFLFWESEGEKEQQTANEENAVP